MIQRERKMMPKRIKKSGLEILKMHGIMSYAQTMEWKGPLSYRIDNTCVIDTSKQIYGTIINTQTLEHASPVSLVGCKRIMTIENKANYESMQYDENTLYIFVMVILLLRKCIF